MTQHMASSSHALFPTTPHSGSRKRALTIGSSPICAEPPSSPPPPQVNDLIRCLEVFGRAKSIDTAIIEAAFESLDSKHFIPDSLEVVPVSHLALLTNLPEGHAVALIKFAKRWCSKAASECKRAKIAH